MSRRRSGPTIGHLIIAARLRGLREAAGLSRDDAAAALGKHLATVRRIECAETALDQAQVETLLAAYGTDSDVGEQLLADVAAASRPGWWHPHTGVMPPGMQTWIGLESSAVTIRIYHGALIPDLLQTEAYARALRRAQNPKEPEETTDAAIALLAERQQRLAARQDAHLWVLMSEAAIRTRIGDDEVMAEQHAALRAAADQPRCTIQVLPFSASWHPMITQPPLRLLRLHAHEIGDHVVVDRLDGQETVDDEHDVAEWRAALDVSAAIASHPGELHLKGEAHV